MALPYGAIYNLSVFRHPIRALRMAVRRWTLREESKMTGADGDFEHPGAIPPELRHFEKGEVLPWKGVMFRVGKVVGGLFPCIILVPTGLTKGAKLTTMREFRDAARRNHVH